ncbi:MAG: restriction endonuclease subunit S [Methylotenera sp.]|nr:restriction endonuclease subunit S [Methylotenera sp.]
MSEWQEFYIEDLAELHNNKRVPLSSMQRASKKGCYPYYGASGIVDHIDEYAFDGEFVLISEDGENLRSRNTPIAFKADGRFWVNNHAHIVKGKKEFHNDLIIYYLKNLDLNQFITGAVQPKLNKASLTSIPFYLPTEEEEQKAIATVLSSLDDKIDLLHRQSTTLECMAETLFRQWFVEESQENWSFVKLGEYVDCFNGVSYKSSELNPSKVAMITLKSFERTGGFRLDGFKEFTGRFKEQHIVKQGDLVVAHTDITQDAEVIGNPVLVVNDTRYETIVISMDLVKVKSKYEWLSNEFLYRMMRTREFKEHCLGYSNGSTVLHLNKQAIPSYEFFLPPINKIESYTACVKELLGKKFKNIEQIYTLEKLRDTLLPKLMSGDISVI